MKPGWRWRGQLQWLGIAVLTAVACAGARARQLREEKATSPADDSSLSAAKRSLATRSYVYAKKQFGDVLRKDATSVPARMGLADAELALHQYQAAEENYRRVVAMEPQMWVAHKNLVIVEAALRRWEEFDRERAVLRAARERGASGISSRESDVIDGLSVGHKHWIVREYFEPVGRSQTRYNFECFAADGRVSEYISLESEMAAEALTPGGDVRVGAGHSSNTVSGPYALNWYTGHAHGIVRVYAGATAGPASEPTYEQVRTDVLRWLRAQTARGRR